MREWRLRVGSQLLAETRSDSMMGIRPWLSEMKCDE